MPRESPVHWQRRGQRIPPERWQAHREILTKLYLENGASHKDIVQVMARDHQLVITYSTLIAMITRSEPLIFIY